MLVLSARIGSSSTGEAPQQKHLSLLIAVGARDDPAYSNRAAATLLCRRHFSPSNASLQLRLHTRGSGHLLLSRKGKPEQPDRSAMQLYNSKETAFLALCFDFFSFPLLGAPGEEDERTLFEERTVASLSIETGDRSPPVITTFMLEARSKLRRPAKLSLCMGTIFGAVTGQAISRFMAFQKLIGVERVYTFSESTSLVEAWKLPSFEVVHHNYSIGRLLFGVDVGATYVDRELAMNYCSSEFGTDEWMMIDQGLDEFMDCPSATQNGFNLSAVLASLIASGRARCGSACVQLCFPRLKMGTAQSNAAADPGLEPWTNHPEATLKHTLGKCVISPSAVRDLRVTINVHGSFGLAPPGLKYGRTAFVGDHLGCALNHYRPGFFKNCPKGAAVPCFEYNGQRMYRPLPRAVRGTLGWATAPVRRFLQLQQSRHDNRGVE